MSAAARRPLRPKEGLSAWATRMLAEGKAMSTQVRGTDGAGRPVARNVVHANFAPKCSDPREFGGECDTGPGNRLEVRMTAPCRRCPECLRRKSSMWACRAVFENKAAPKTYFVTLTLAPDAWVLLDVRARQRAWEADKDTGELVNRWDEWTEHQRSWAFFLEAGKEVTKYLKRVRKALEPWRLRYSMYNERGDIGGREHIHLLVHVYAPLGEAGTWDDTWWALVSKWKHWQIVPNVPLGIAEAEQVRHAEKGGWYVAGYLKDSSHNRARASLRYGPPRVRSLTGKPPVVDSPVVPSLGTPEGKQGPKDVTQ